MAQAKVKADVPIEALLKEKRKFPPSPAFVKRAVMNRKAIYAEAQRNPVKFWEQRARELHWFKPWKKALEWKPPYAKWFVGGKLNVAYNCLDRHVAGPRKTKAALIWEGEPGDSRVLTYWDLYREVNQFAAALKKNTDEALRGAPGVKTVIVLKRTGQPVEMQSGRDIWWDDFIKGAPARCPAEPMDSEDLLYLLYTSGSTGKPKGIIHTTGGYLTGIAATHKWVFDLHEEDVFWCTADVGWVTGHSYVVYGPLANGATSVMYEGTPDFPDKDRFWRIIEKHGITICYTAPTAIRTFMRWGEEYPNRCDLSSLRLLGTVGEPINPEAWVWYWKGIGRGNCPVVDTWWQTATGNILITPLPGVTVLKPGSATRPFPGIDAEVLDDQGRPAKAGYLVLRKPWPGMLRGIWGDPDRYVKQYWSKYPDIYFTGDGAKRDRDGYFWLLGRVDDVMNVSGHRVSTMEVESALVDHKAVAEAAVIGKNHDIKGQAISAFVTVKGGVDGTPALMDELKSHVAKKIGALARPDDIIFSAELPKTRSGKIMRRLLRDIAEGRALGDTTTLADPAVVASLKTKYEDQEG